MFAFQLLQVKAMTVTKSSSAYWEGNDKAESLQRVYGISFPDNKQLKEWIQFQEEAAKRDHRKIGRVCVRAAPQALEWLLWYAGTIWL